MKGRGPSALSWMIAGVAFCVCQPALAGAQMPTSCDEFYDALAAVPHVSLTRSFGSFESIWDAKIYDGCEIEFETNDSIRAGADVPIFFADSGTEMYGAGWRMSREIGADGAGSGIHGIEKGSVVCIIRWEQPAYIDDDGEFVESDTRRQWVQCREREVG